MIMFRLEFQYVLFSLYLSLPTHDMKASSLNWENKTKQKHILVNFGVHLILFMNFSCISCLANQPICLEYQVPY